METIVNISLNGYPYKLTNEAYRVLRQYLDALINRFGQSGEAKETYEAIEARFGELLSERQKGNDPFSAEDIKSVIAILGQPEDIDAEQERKTANEKESAEERNEKERNRMSLYRDVDHKMLGGVCAGIAARLGIELAIVRLIFILATLLYGASILVYIVLWAAVPPANTPLQKLRMKGSPITLSSIQNEANRSYQAARNAMNGRGGKTSSSFLNSLGNLFIIIAVTLAKVIWKILGFAFIIAGAAGGMAITVLLVIALCGDVSLAEKLFGDSTGTVISLLGWNVTPRIVAIAIWGVAIVPLAGLLLGGMQMLMKFHIAKIVNVIMLVFWIASIVTLAILMPITDMRANKRLAEFDTEYPIPMRSRDTLQVDLRIEDPKGKIFGTPEIIIRSTDDYMASVRLQYNAFNPDMKAEHEMENFYTPNIDTASLMLANLWALRTDSIKALPFNVRAIIYLPEGARIKLTPETAKRARGLSEHRTLKGKDLAKNVWQMRDGYLATPNAGQGEKPSTKNQDNQKANADSVMDENTTTI